MYPPQGHPILYNYIQSRNHGTENKYPRGERNNSDSEDASQETPNATELQAIIEPPRIIPRRSTRQRRKPQWHQTYSMSMIDKTDAIRKLSESGFFMDSPRHITDMVIKAVL